MKKRMLSWVLALALAVTGLGFGMTAEAEETDEDEPWNESGQAMIDEEAYVRSPVETYSSYSDPAGSEAVSLTGDCNYTYAYKVLDQVNSERKANGLSSLTMDKDLLAAAMQRAAETAIYWDHVRPNAYYCYTVCDKVYGENIAAGQTSASQVMTDWMNSTDHRKNILTSGYTSIGIGCFKHNGIYYWTQEFGYNTADTGSKPSNTSKSFTVELDAEQLTGALTLVFNDTSVKTGKTKKLSADFYNYGAISAVLYVYASLDGKSVKWSSGTTSVATVSSSGKVTGKSVGSSKIKVKTKNGILSDSLKVKVKLATPSVTVSNTGSGVKIKWGKVTGAKGYYIYRKSGSGSYKKIATVKKGSTTSYTNKKSGAKKVTAGKTYSYKVTAYSGSNTSSKSSAAKIVYQSKPKLTSVKNSSSKKATVKWNKKSGVTGYQIRYSTKKDFSGGVKKVKVKGASKKSTTISKLTGGKTYYFEVRTYKKVSGKTYYSAWSSAKKVKIKK